jgi:2-(1,2-epoxy-1,2-dihydrophenyl)acetyl-CoA isomerase
MAETPVLIEREAGLAVLTLNRPDSYNAINQTMMQALLDALVDCDEDASVRAVLLTGAGKAFCAGGDLKAMQAEDAAGGSVGVFLKRLTVPVHGAISTMARMEKPVIGAINGVAGGAGFSFALACDLVLAAESAVFTMAYTKAGLAPDGGSSFFLPRVVGPKRAYDLMVNNAVLTAQEARELGAAKRLIALSPESSLETQMEHERRAIAACAGTEDFSEGVAAFVDKRPPKFEGR